MVSAALFVLATLPLAAFAEVHQVQVGDANGNTVFSPEAIFANQGDQVVFTFHQKNHSVVRSSFANPCGPTDVDGFNSGFMPVPPGQSDNFPTYTIDVKDTKPIWVYCAQKQPVSHCNKGMVFAVNCGASGSPNSFDNFKAAAIALGSGGSPSGPPSPTGTISIPPAPPISEVTATVSVSTSMWTTTYGSYPNSPAPTPNSLEGNVIKVTVGENGQLAFNPPELHDVRPRDTIVFEFRAKNHTATQSTFANPCVQLHNETTGQVGFDSGFMPVPAGSTQFPTYNFTVKDTSPTWVFCRQTGHCGQGMVMAINADDTSPRSFTAFTTLAKQINGTANSASNTDGSSPASPSPSSKGKNGATRTTGIGAVGLITIVGGIMAML